MGDSAAGLFDATVIQEGDSRRTLTPGEFLGLPLFTRVQHLFQQTVWFYLDGVEQNRQVVLSALRARRTVPGDVTHEA